MSKRKIEALLESLNIKKDEKMSMREMEDKFESLDREDVVSIYSDQILLTNRTFTISEFIAAILPLVKGQYSSSNWTEKKESWFGKGIDCKILQPGKNWQKGKVRITLEFCPETVEVEETQASEPAASEESSPLDEIRQMKI
ncbi:KGK domain-containing protein [Microcoleus sp. FACHB-672]|uniref:KGK domain-containing protein n=1 Tax=Microcoleus sp. FACHB-672 TaxID=2692825 RepID=UPI0016888873|nr:KGK domain-containing protein [Microcoleus sp. FACHB-672]MBD2039764.1 KGK family protein [Microcoleus sp. FACHB-672]